MRQLPVDALVAAVSCDNVGGDGLFLSGRQMSLVRVKEEEGAAVAEEERERVGSSKTGKRKREERGPAEGRDH